MDLYFLAKKINLTAIGIADADAVEFDHLKGWLDKGYHGEMGWLAKNIDRRCDPRIVMPGCKSVIVCAMKYDEMGGYEHYHEAMMKKLEAVAAAIKEGYPEAQCKCYVDTGPVLEKTWGARAGIGFIGKNTLLISQEHGSQMALGVVLTDADVKQEAGNKKQDNPPSFPFKKGGLGKIFHASCLVPHASSCCGSCTACIDSCPTKALVAPYILDARKCISYEFFIAKENGKCDICQDVCQFNKE